MYSNGESPRNRHSRLPLPIPGSPPPSYSVTCPSDYPPHPQPLNSLADVNNSTPVTCGNPLVCLCKDYYPKYLGEYRNSRECNHHAPTRHAACCNPYPVAYAYASNEFNLCNFYGYGISQIQTQPDYLYLDRVLETRHPVFWNRSISASQVYYLEVRDATTGTRDVKFDHPVTRVGKVLSLIEVLVNDTKRKKIIVYWKRHRIEPKRLSHHITMDELINEAEHLQIVHRRRRIYAF